MIRSLEDSDLSWKPNFNARTVQQLVSHLATLPESDVRAGMGELQSAEEIKKFEDSFKINTSTDAAEILEKGMKYVVDFFTNISTRDMNSKKVQFFYQQEKETYTHLLLEIIEHLSLHKGILYVYMRELGYNAGMGTYYGFQPAAKR